MSDSVEDAAGRRWFVQDPAVIRHQSFLERGGDGAVVDQPTTVTMRFTLTCEVPAGATLPEQDQLLRRVLASVALGGATGRRIAEPAASR